MKLATIPLLGLFLCDHATGGSFHADVLWDNGIWDGQNAAPSSRDTARPDAWVIDDVIFAGNGEIHGYVWYALLEGFDPVRADLIILSLNFDKLVELNDLPLITERIGEGFGIPLFRMTIEGINIPLDAGRYFIGARPVGEGAGRAFIGTNQTILGEDEAYFRGEPSYPDWTPMSQIEGVPRDGAFTVFGEVTGEQVLPDDFTIVFGQLLDGDIESLHESDDDSIRISNRPAASLSLPMIRMIVEGETVIDEASTIAVTVETAADSQPSRPPQRLQAWDFIAQQWITIDERPATLSDSTIEVILNADPTRFIEPDTGRLRIRLDWFDPGPVVNIGWGVRIDHVEWEVVR